MPKFLKSIGSSLALCTAGALLALAFSPIKIKCFAFLMPMVLIYFLKNASLKKSIFYSGLFGLGYFGCGISWVFVSIDHFGHLPFSVSLLLTILFVLFFSLYFALQGFIVFALMRRKNKENKGNSTFYLPLYYCLIAFPLSWILTEWLRAEFLTGFPWLLLGYSQVGSLLNGWIPLLGQYGVGFLCLTISGALFMFIESVNRYYCATIKNQKDMIAAFYLILYILILGLLSWVFSQIKWTQAQGRPLKVSLIQGNIPQDEKWLADHIIPTLKRYDELTDTRLGDDLIVWPEAAVTLPFDQAQEYLETLDAKARLHQSAIILGGLAPAPEQQSYYNAMLLIGTAQGQYNKRHLVMFGEYFPLGIGRLLAFFNLPYGSLAEGALHQALLQVRNVKISPFICYEIVLSRFLYKDMPEANLLVLISNDAWFDHSFASAQHLEIGQFRALQSGRPLLVATNTGLTAIVNEYGKLAQLAPADTPYILSGQVIPRTGRTPWDLWGDGLILLILLGLLII